MVYAVGRNGRSENWKGRSEGNDRRVTCEERTNIKTGSKKDGVVNMKEP